MFTDTVELSLRTWTGLTTSTKKKIPLSVAYLHTSFRYKFTPASVWFVGPTFMHLLRDNKNKWAAEKEAWHATCELKSRRQRCFYSCHSPFFHVGPPGSNAETDWHTNHLRDFWHRIQLFLNAGHSQEFIFMQCISSVTCSQYSGSGAHSLAADVLQSIQSNYTCSRTTSRRFQLASKPLGR